MDPCRTHELLAFTGARIDLDHIPGLVRGRASRSRTSQFRFRASWVLPGRALPGGAFCKCL